MSKITSEASVKTGLDLERIVAIDSDHPGLCNLDVQSSYFAEMCKFIDESLEDARLRVGRGSPTCEYGTRTPKRND